MNFDPEHPRVSVRLRKPSRNRAGRYLSIILGAGGLAALTAIMIAAIPTVLSFDFPRNGSQILANQAFPSAHPTHQIVNVYDPAPSYVPPPPSEANPPPVERESPTAPPPPTAQPSESPEPHDN